MKTLRHRIASDTRYVMVGFPATVIAFILIVAGVAAGIGSAVAFVGLPILAATAVLAGKFADLERASLPDVVGRPLARPDYPEAPAGASWFRRTMNPLVNGQAGLDLLHAIVALPFAVAAFTLTAVWWVGAIAGLTFPLYGWTLARIPEFDGGLPALLGLGDSETVFIMFNTGAGVLFALTLPVVLRFAALIKAGPAQALLTRPAHQPHPTYSRTENAVAA